MNSSTAARNGEDESDSLRFKKSTTAPLRSRLAMFLTVLTVQTS
jgi:hypothetical protein